MILPAVFLASAVFAVNLTVQALSATTLVRVVMPWSHRLAQRWAFWGRIAALEITLLLLLVTILLQIGVWAGVFLYLGQFADYQTAFYHSAVNFTTLGYGDLVMSENTRLLGPLEAVNGSIMLGLSGATLFTAMGRASTEP
jgi:hypothetical protein